MIPVLAVLKFTRSSQNAFDAVGHKRHKIYEMDFTSASEMQQSWGREMRRLLSFENIYLPIGIFGILKIFDFVFFI